MPNNIENEYKYVLDKAVLTSGFPYSMKSFITQGWLSMSQRIRHEIFNMEAFDTRNQSSENFVFTTKIPNGDWDIEIESNIGRSTWDLLIPKIDKFLLKNRYYLDDGWVIDGFVRHRNQEEFLVMAECECDLNSFPILLDFINNNLIYAVPKKEQRLYSNYAICQRYY